MEESIDTTSAKPQTQSKDHQNPLVSVVLPTFNRSSEVKKAIDSVIHQSYKNLELIIVDDGSTDDTPQILSSYSDPRIRIIRFKENRGANAARNAGVMASNAEYIAFQDSDDEWVQEKLDIQISGCLKHDASVAFSSLDRHHNGTFRRIPKTGYRVPEGFHDLAVHVLRGSFVSCQTIVAKKQLLIDVGLFDEELPRLQDWDIAIKMAFKKAFLFFPQPLVRATIGKDSISADSQALVRSTYLIFSKHSEKFQIDRTAGAMLFFNTALSLNVRKHPLTVIRLAISGLKKGGFLASINALLTLVRRR